MKTKITHSFLHTPPMRVMFILFLCLALLLCLGNMALAQTQTYTSDGTFIAPAGATNVTVNAWGGGGGGGGRSSSYGSTARGGGGGAFALKALNISPSTTYTVDVGAGGAGGPAGNNAGSDGAPSLFYLTVGSPLVRAAGGSGGSANTSGAGGLGGTVANSIGDSPTPYKGGDAERGGGGGAGTNGAGGNTSDANGGTGTAVGGGDGGTAPSGTFVQENGRPGNNYGGGGSGARYSTSGSWSGGNGAPGQITITYTCPTYSLASASGTNPCTGSTSTITLSGGNLPNGTYTVNYTLGGANSGTFNATMTVTGGTNSGTFTTTSLANGGSTTVTINSLASGSGVGGATLCTSTISTGNVATIWVGVPAQPSTITGTTPVCAGSTGITYSVTNVANVTYTWSYSGSNASIVTGQGSSSISVNYATNATSGTWTVTPSNACGNGTTRTFAVTVNPIVTPTFTQVDPICSGGALSALPTTSNNGITGTWAPALNNLATTEYTFTPTTGQCATTANMTVLVNPLPTFTYTKSDLSCFAESDGEIFINAAGGSGSGYQYQYRYRTDENASWGDWSGWINLDIDFDGLQPGQYEIQVRDSNGCIQTEEQVIP